MSKLYLLFASISIIFGVTCYFGSNNIYCALIVGLISLLYFMVFAIPRVKKFLFKESRFHLCYSFINTFVIALSVKGTIGSAYESATMMMDDDFQKIIKGINHLNTEDSLKYLQKVFPFDVYSLFLNIVNLYTNQGGDILKMSAYLIEETRGIEEYITGSKSLCKKNVVEFSILWLLSLVILIVLRFTLSNFYMKMTKNILYVAAIGFLFFFVIISIEIFIRRSTSLNIKGWNNHEKYI